MTVRFPIACSVLLTAFVLRYPAAAAPPDAINGLRFDEPFERVVTADRVFSALRRRSPNARPFALELERAGERLLWEVRAVTGERAYTLRGSFASAVQIARFDAFDGTLIDVRTERAALEPPILPNQTPRPYDGPTTPCPHGANDPGLTFPPGTVFTTPPPNAIAGQNYRCPRPPARARPSANASAPLRTFPSLPELYDAAYVRARAAGQYVVELRLEPYGAWQARSSGNIIRYDSEAGRTTLVTSTIAPHGMSARNCFYDHALTTSTRDALGGAGGGSSIRGKCREGTFSGPQRLGATPEPAPTAPPSFPPLPLRYVYTGGIDDYSMVVAHDGSLWFDSFGKTVHVVGGTRTIVGPLPAAKARTRIAFADVDDGVWLTAYPDALFHVFSDGRTEVVGGGPKGVDPSLVRGDGVWYADFERGRLARLQHEKLDVFAIPTKYAGPTNLVDAGGTLWFYERVGKKYAAWQNGRFVEIPADDAVVLLVPGTANDAWALVAPAGGNSTQTRSFVLKHLRVGRPPDAFPITTANGIESMAVAVDGSLWLGEAVWPTLAHFQPANASFTEFTIAGATRYGWARDMRPAPDEHVYVLLNDHRVGVIP